MKQLKVLAEANPDLRQDYEAKIKALEMRMNASLSSEFVERELNTAKEVLKDMDRMLGDNERGKRWTDRWRRNAIIR